MERARRDLDKNSFESTDLIRQFIIRSVGEVRVEGRWIPVDEEEMTKQAFAIGEVGSSL
jgi:hypothetical protein